MTAVIATGSIRRNPTGRKVATGQFDALGNAILRSVADEIVPGTLFEIEDGEELELYRKLNVVRDLSPEEEILWEKTGRHQ